MAALNSIQSDLIIANELVYDKCGFVLTGLMHNLESAAYGACSFRLNEKTIQFRVSKITPAKTGQFVAIWKRNKDGFTVPFDISDNIDFIIISSKNGEKYGQFIFPKSVLAANGVISRNGIEGKRGIRVYPPWDLAKNEQAVKTQCWQKKYFLPIRKGIATDLELARRLLTGIILVIAVFSFRW